MQLLRGVIDNQHQTALFAPLAEIRLEELEEWNVIMLAYETTRSDKTHTMFGTEGLVEGTSKLLWRHAGFFFNYFI